MHRVNQVMMATSLVSYIDRNAKTTPAICRYGCLKINIPKEISAFKQRFFKKGPLEESFTFFCSPTFCVISIEARLFGWRISFSPKLVGCKEYREEYKTARGFFFLVNHEAARGILLENSPPSEDASTLPLRPDVEKRKMYTNTGESGYF